MHIIGITGGVGVGKSTVLAYLQQQYHAHVIQADLVAKQLQQKGQQVFEDIVAAFGASIVTEEGDLDRQALAGQVFGDEAKLKLLNAIVHPAVQKKILKEIELLDEAEQNEGFVFIEAALLIEAHYDEICEEMWYIDTEDAIRTQRLKESRGYTDEKIRSMLANQKTREEFTAACQVVINNGTAFTDTCRQIDLQMHRLKNQLDS